jgi:hypothetical protein
MKTRPCTGKLYDRQLGQQSVLGKTAQSLKDKSCRENRGRVYILSSLVVAENVLQLHYPKPSVPDYRRSVGWAYKEFWKRL